MQNVVSITYTPEELAQMDSALATLRGLFARMVALTPDQRRELYKMGDKSEPFCRQTLAVLTANPQIVPPNLGLAEAQADLSALDALRPACCSCSSWWNAPRTRRRRWGATSSAWRRRVMAC